MPAFGPSCGHLSFILIPFTATTNHRQSSFRKRLGIFEEERFGCNETAVGQLVSVMMVDEMDENTRRRNGRWRQPHNRLQMQQLPMSWRRLFKNCCFVAFVCHIDRQQQQTLPLQQKIVGQLPFWLYRPFYGLVCCSNARPDTSGKFCPFLFIPKTSILCIFLMCQSTHTHTHTINFHKDVKKTSEGIRAVDLFI